MQPNCSKKKKKNEYHGKDHLVVGNGNTLNIVHTGIPLGVLIMHHDGNIYLMWLNMIYNVIYVIICLDK